MIALLIIRVPNRTIITMTLNLIRTTTNNHIINIVSISTIIISTGMIRVIRITKDIILSPEGGGIIIQATTDSLTMMLCHRETTVARAGGTGTITTTIIMGIIITGAIMVKTTIITKVLDLSTLL
jgi:hypothetical protein